MQQIKQDNIHLNDIKIKLEYILDFLANKLGKVTEDKIIQKLMRKPIGPDGSN